MKRALPLLVGIVLVLAGFILAREESEGQHDPNAQIVGGPKHSEMSKRPDKGENKKYNETKRENSDKQFLKEAAQGGLAEVQLGQLAAKKASDPQVKQFGERMQNDHGKANQELKQVAAKKGVQLPKSLSSEDQALKDKLSGLSGQQFDAQYMQAMVSDHQHDVSEFQKEANGAEDQQIKDFAEKTLPTLQDHLKQAEDVLGKVGQGTKQNGTPAH